MEGTVNETVEEIYSDDRTGRIVLFKRPSGSFGHREEYFYRNDYFPDNVIKGWASLGKGASYYDSLEIAKTEVIANVHCLSKGR